MMCRAPTPFNKSATMDFIVLFVRNLVILLLQNIPQVRVKIKSKALTYLKNEIGRCHNLNVVFFQWNVPQSSNVVLHFVPFKRMDSKTQRKCVKFQDF